jgi:arylsulfatase A-like enzyme
MPCAGSSSVRARPRAAVPFSALAALLLALTACERPVAPDDALPRLRALRPNLVLIVVDTLRADWTSAYGYAQETTPELVRWAGQGVLFERVRAQSSWTKISVASLMTSLWPGSHGVRDYADGLGEGALTLAETLSQAGYATFGVQTNGWLHPSFGFQQGFDRYVFPAGPGAGRIPKATVWPHADRVLEETHRLLEARPEGRPFFLYLHFMDVHEYAAPNEFKRFGSDDRGAYLASIRWVDDALTRVRQALDEAGVLEETLIALTSDHGETFGENGKSGHARNVLTAVVSVPFVLRLPFPIEPVRVPGQVRGIDVAPTVLDALGVAVPESFEGASLWPAVAAAAAGRPEPDRESFASLGLPLFPDASVQEALHTGDWTLARNVDPDPNPAELLYDCSVDPGENVNLIEREPKEAARMRALLDAHLAHEPVAGVLERGVRIDPQIAEKLRALGYMQ